MDSEQPEKAKVTLEMAKGMTLLLASSAGKTYKEMLIELATDAIKEERWSSLITCGLLLKQEKGENENG